MKTIEQSFFERDTVAVAHDLLGFLLVSIREGKKIAGRIVETEAYPGMDDPACHAFRGKTKRNEALFGHSGYAYVYLSYGLHSCINVVAHPVFTLSGGVLIRAVEPLEGIDIMKEYRKIDKLRDLTNGPGKVGQAFGITLQDNCTDLMNTQSPLYLLHDQNYTCEIVATKRIGITKNVDVLWRFVVKGSEFISR